MKLRFGIPSLDELLDLRGKSQPTATAAKLRVHPVESFAVVGADGSGKSVLALHMASRYHADAWALPALRDRPRTPRILYVSSDLRYGAALQVWENFRLDRPNTRHVPFERIPDSMGRYWIEEKKTYESLCLRELKTSTDQPGDARALMDYLLPPSGDAEPAEIGFLDLATHTAGDDWNFVNGLLAKLDSIKSCQDGNGVCLPHLVIIDSVLGFETFVGRLDAYGTEQSRRARIAQCIRNAGIHCHLVFVVEEPNEREHLPEEFVTDVVLRLRQRKRGSGVTRTLEIEKARARNHSGGEHPFEIRSREGSSTRGWENADAPVSLNDYVHVLHSIAHRSALVARYKGVDVPEEAVGGFGAPYLDQLLNQGLSAGTCNTLIGDASTGKSALAGLFLGYGFKELITRFIHIYARFHKRARENQAIYDESWSWVLNKLATSILAREGKWQCTETDPAKAVAQAIEHGIQQTILKLKESEYQDESENPWIKDWHLHDTREGLRKHLQSLCTAPKTRTGLVFALSNGPEPRMRAQSGTFNPAGGAKAIQELFNHPNLRWPAVLLTTANHQPKEVAIDCLAYFRHHIEEEMDRCFGAHKRKAWSSMEESVIRFLERQIIVRRFDIADQPAPVVLHAIIRNLLEAKKLVFGPFFPTSQELHKVKADRIRLVIDDFRVLCNTSPDVLKDSAFLPFLTFQLGRSGINNLLVYSDAVRPDTRPDDETSRALLSLSKRSILVWRVPFEGRTRFALTVIPPTDMAYSDAARELKLVQPRQWALGRCDVSEKMERILVPSVTPKFELYSGVERGEPTPVPLAVYLFAETKQFAAYAEEENALFSEMFKPVDTGSAVAPGRVIFPLNWTRYLAMRDYTRLSLDKLDGHTMVFQVDGSWAVEGECALIDQDDYIRQQFSVDADDRSVQDPFHLFDGHHPRRLDYFRNAHYNFERDASDRKDRVPFMWDFGFVLARSAPWQAAGNLPVESKLERAKGQGTCSTEQLALADSIIPFKDRNNTVQAVLDYLSDPHKHTEQRDKGGISWRKFFGACRLVADIHRAQTGAQAVAFDVSASSPETINSLILEIWFSEILLEEKQREAARRAFHPKSKSRLSVVGQSLETILRGDCSQGTKIQTVFKEFKEKYARMTLNYYDHWRKQRKLASDPAHEATDAEKMKMFERRNVEREAIQQVNDLFATLPIGAFCLYKTWLLLTEVLNFEDYFDPENPFTFRLGRSASMQAVASRHWYKTACSFATQLYETEGIHDAMVPLRLPGSFSVRGDWFLGSPRSSRSRLLARHAFDLLCSRRANLTRMQYGLGLPVRDVVEDDEECGRLRTALRCRVPESDHAAGAGENQKTVGSTQMPYGRLATLGNSKEDRTDGFQWLWRPRIPEYDRQSRTLQKWTARMFRWTVELRESLARDWQGGFGAYDHLTCRRFAELYEYQSFWQFAEHVDLLVEELRASSRKKA